jgi:hypothetical protein
MTPSRTAMHFFVAIRIRVNILLLGEKIAGSGGIFFGFVDISHRRYEDPINSYFLQMERGPLLVIKAKSRSNTKMTKHTKSFGNKCLVT